MLGNTHTFTQTESYSHYVPPSSSPQLARSQSRVAQTNSLSIEPGPTDNIVPTNLSKSRSPTVTRNQPSPSLNGGRSKTHTRLSFRSTSFSSGLISGSYAGHAKSSPHLSKQQSRSQLISLTQSSPVAPTMQGETHPPHSSPKPSVALGCPTGTTLNMCNLCSLPEPQADLSVIVDPQGAGFVQGKPNRVSNDSYAVPLTGSMESGSGYQLKASLVDVISSLNITASLPEPHLPQGVTITTSVYQTAPHIRVRAWLVGQRGQTLTKPGIILLTITEHPSVTGSCQFDGREPCLIEIQIPSNLFSSTTHQVTPTLQFMGNHIPLQKASVQALPIYQTDPPKGMTLQLPFHPIQPSTSFSSNLVAFCGEQIMESVDVQITYDASVMTIDSINDDGKFKGATNLESGRATIVWTRQSGVSNSQVTGRVPFASVQFRILSQASAASGNIQFTVRSLGDVQNVPVVPQNTAGIVKDATSSSNSGLVRVAVDSVRGYHLSPAQQDIVNPVPLTGVGLRIPIKVLQFREFGTIQDISQTALCTADDTVALTLQGCIMKFTGTETRGASSIAISFNTSTTNVRVWFPSPPATLSIKDHTLNAVDGWKDASCQADVYQKSALSANVTFSAGALGFLADVTDIVQFESSNPSVAQIQGKYIQGLSSGQAIIRLRSFSSNTITATVANTPVHTTGIDVVVFTDLMFAPYDSQSLTSPTSVSSVGILVRQALDFEDKTAFVASYARFSDGTRMDISLSPGLNVSSTSPSASITLSPLRVVAKEVGCGHYINVTWSSCGRVLGSGLGLVRLNLPRITQIFASINTPRIVHTHDVSAAAGVATFAPISVSALFENGVRSDYSLDPRAIFDAETGDPNNLIEVQIAESNGIRIRVGVIATGRGIGQARLYIRLSNAPDIPAVYLVVNVVEFDHLELIPRPYPAFPGSESMRETLLSRIQCTSVFQKATLQLYMHLSDGYKIDISTNPESRYETNQAGSDVVSISNRIVTPSGARFQSVSLIASFMTESTTLDIQVSNDHVQVTSVSSSFPSTFSGIVGTTRPLEVSAVLSDNTQFLDARTLGGLLSYSSSNNQSISIDLVTGFALLKANSHQAVDLVATTCAGVQSTSVTFGNLLPDVGDVDFGSGSGVPFSALSIGTTRAVEVRVNTGSNSLGSIDFTMTYNAELLSAESYSIGSDWPGGQFEVTLNDPPGIVRFVGAATPSSSKAGASLRLASVTLKGTRNGQSIVGGYISKFVANNAQSTPIGNPIQIGESREIVAGSFTAVTGIVTKNSDSALVPPHIQKPLSKRTSSCEPSSIRGNVDGDCEFSVLDVQFALRKIAGLISQDLAPWQVNYLDADNNGEIQVTDAVYLIRVLAGKWRFFDVDISEPTSSDPKFNISLVAQDSNGEQIYERTQFEFIILTSKNKQLTISTGSMKNQVDSGVVAVPKITNGTFVLVGQVVADEAVIGLSIRQITYDSFNQSAVDRDVTFYQGVGGVLIPYISWKSLYAPSEKIQPFMRTATFDSSAQTISVTLSHPASRGSLSVQFDCGSLFYGLNGLSCEWSSDTVIIVRTNCTGVVTVGETLTLLPDVLRMKDSNTPSLPFAGSVATTIAPGSITVNVMLSGPQRVGKCSKIVIDASQSITAGNRCSNLLYIWTLESSTATKSQLAQYSGVLQNAKGLLELSEELPAGHTYTIKLDLHLPSGFSATGSIDVIKVDMAIPELQIDGPSARNVYPSQTSTISAIAKLPSCLNGSSFQFQWTQSSGPSITLNAITASTRSLTITPFQLLPLQTYVFQVEACVPLVEGACNTASVTVRALSSGLRAIVAGGSASVYGTKRDFQISADPSFDPDVQIQDKSKHVFTWTCQTRTGGSCINANTTQALQLSQAPTIDIIQVPNIQLAPGFYTFRVSFSIKDAGYTPVFAEKLVEVVDGDPPIVSLSPLSQPRPSISRILRLLGSVSYESSANLVYSWVINDGAISLSDINISQGSGNSLRLVIPELSLSQDTEYTFRLVANDPVSKIAGYSEIAFRTNVLPYGGDFQVPSSGGQQMDRFLMTALGWTSLLENLPLSFAFGYQTSSDGAEQIVSDFAASPRREIVMPVGRMPGSDSTMTYVKAFVIISDIAGNSRKMQLDVSVKPLHFENDTARVAASSRFVEEQMQAALSFGDYDTVGQYNLGSMDILNSQQSASRTLACSEAQNQASSVRTTAFSILKNMNVKQLMTSYTQTDSNIKQFSSVLSDPCIAESLAASAVPYLTELAEKSISTSVASTTGSAMAAAYEGLFASMNRISLHSGTSNITSSPANILLAYMNATKLIGRSGLLEKACGEAGYSSEGATLSSYSTVACSDVLTPTTISIDSSGNAAVSLSRGALDLTSNPIVHISSSESVPFNSTSVSISSSVLTVTMESKDNSYAEVPVKNLQDRINITLPLNNPGNLNSNSEQTCMYYDEDLDKWSTDGCTRVFVDDAKLICSCNHLTSFASVLRTLTQKTPTPLPRPAVSAKPSSLPTTGKGPASSNVGAIVGGVIGGLGGFAMLAGVAFIIYKRRSQLNRIFDQSRLPNFKFKKPKHFGAQSAVVSPAPQPHRITDGDDSDGSKSEGSEDDAMEKGEGKLPVMPQPMEMLPQNANVGLAPGKDSKNADDHLSDSESDNSKSEHAEGPSGVAGPALLHPNGHRDAVDDDDDSEDDDESASDNEDNGVGVSKNKGSSPDGSGSSGKKKVSFRETAYAPGPQTSAQHAKTNSDSERSDSSEEESDEE
eukprot:TRINITY_DN2243_c0_g1_i4.p1 TRINITY_DN2243_c0_g1~~TRINITY_DN2243_c0_g1_i4.p1  ORF type:complete len:2855 (+),score=488.56 TRINITY_DN2243_c0_g1_i4:336-8567(+)